MRWVWPSIASMPPQAKSISRWASPASAPLALSTTV
jgi:hypothetical protein